MPRKRRPNRRVLTPALAAALVLLVPVTAGCGSQVATGPAGTAPSAEMAERARQAGVDAELVYVLDVDGFERVAGGTGPYGDSGFQDIYFSPSGGDIRLTVERSALDAAGCPGLPIPAAEPFDAPVACVDDGGGWERTSGDRQEYARLDGDRLVRVSGRIDGASMDQLRDMTRAAHPASASDLDELLPPAQPGAGSSGGSIVRGDLPATGDGAPDNSVGPGG